MGRPSKFTAAARAKVLEALGYGASRVTAANYAGVDEATLRRWVARGKEQAAGPWHDFLIAVLEAEAQPKVRALRVISDDVAVSPTTAWKFVERREPGFAPPMIHQPAAVGAPVIIQLGFADSTIPALTPPETVIEVGTVEPDDEPDPS